MNPALPRGTYSDPVAAASVAAEGVRALNHATIWDGYPYAADLSSVIGSLATMAERLPQALDQGTAWLERVHAAGLLGHDRDDLGSGLDLSVAVADITAALTRARTAAEALTAALTRAGQESSHLSGGGS